jgi:FMN reductase
MTMSTSIHRPSSAAVEEQRTPHVVVIGGTTRAGSTTERLGRRCVEILSSRGVTSTMFPATELQFPMYAPERPERTAGARLFVEEIRRCDGLILASPGYHGGISGLLKNALDYIEDLKTDRRSYLDGRAVGCVVTAAGFQGANTTLGALRSVVHALRGWPTPLGVAVNSTMGLFEPDGRVDPVLDAQLSTLVDQVTHLARISARATP